jgi:hypothetical protein
MHKTTVPRKHGFDCDFATSGNTSVTKEAGALKREALSQRRANSQGGFNSMTEDEVIALEAEADAMITRTVTWLELPGGEVPGLSEQGNVSRPVVPHGAIGAIGQLTSQGNDRIAEDASLIRLDLLNVRELDCAPMALDAVNAVKAGDSLEKMLAHQMAVAHELAMRFSARAMQCRFPEQSVEACRYSAAVARQMVAYQSAMLTLHRTRQVAKADIGTGGEPRVPLTLAYSRREEGVQTVAQVALRANRSFD